MVLMIARAFTESSSSALASQERGPAGGHTATLLTCLKSAIFIDPSGTLRLLLNSCDFEQCHETTVVASAGG